MGIFRRKSLAAELDGLNARKELLGRQLATTEARLDEALTSRQTRLLEGDPADVTNEPPINIERLRDEKSAVIDALAAIDSKIMDAQASVDREQDRVRREAGSKELAALVEDLIHVRDELAAVAAKVAPAIAAILNKVPAPHPVAPERVGAFLAGVLDATQTVVSEGQLHATRLISGDAQIVRAVSEPVKPPVPAVERTPIFLLGASRWQEGGEVFTSGAHLVVSPPAPVAARALEFRHALDPLSNDAVVLRQRCPPRYGFYPPEDCADLNEPKPAKQPAGSRTITAPPVHFEFVGRARGGVASVARNPR